MNSRPALFALSPLLLAVAAPSAHGMETDAERLLRLERELGRLQQVILLQQERLQTQQAELQRIRAELLDTPELERRRATGPAPDASIRISQADAAPPEKPVGKAPPKKKNVVERQEIQSIANVGGVLTPRGTWVLEPSLQFSNSQVNRLSFLGVEILETFLIGILEAQDADRDLVSPALTLRYGITPRLEVEGKLPYVWRDDMLQATIPSVVSEPQVTRDLEGEGIGDVELAVHYQINAGNEGWPIFIGNVRYKSTTGEGPYDVARNSAGIQTELPTGSGFHAIEPSVTALYPSDPAVFYANLGYLHNFDDDVNKTFVIEGGDNQTVGNVDPGDALRMSFGMAYSINSRASFSLGYKHDFIRKSRATINGTTLSTSSLDVGAMLLGFSHQVTDRLTGSVNLELGVTADAPDVAVTLRLPYTL